MLAGHPLDDLLGTPASVRVLRALSTSPDAPLTGRELARRSGVAPSQAALALKRLEAKGVAWRRVVGRSDQWLLDRTAALTSMLLELFSSEQSLQARMLDELRQTLRQLPLREALVFGSVARGDATDRSDLDVFIRVRNRADAGRVYAGLLDLRLELMKKYGVDLSPLILTEEDLRHPSNPKLIQNVRRDGIPLMEG